MKRVGDYETNLYRMNNIANLPTPGAPAPAFGIWDSMSLMRNPMSEVKLTVGGAMEEEA